MSRKKGYEVKLSESERNHLKKLTSSGEDKARKLRRAHILLKVDEGWSYEEISQALSVGCETVSRVCEQYATQGLERSLNRQSPCRVYEQKADGQIEAHLVALVCGSPPEGYARWTLRLLADRLVKLEQIELTSISHETVRQVLKKNELKPWQNKQWVIAPQANAEFVCAMEDVLDLYHEPYDPLRPVVCFDETNKQLISETRTPLPMMPGYPQRYDYEYERHGTCNIFMFSEPLAAWRQVQVTDQRTKIDYAQAMKYLAEARYPTATQIRVVQDNLNTHIPSALYEAFPPEEAHRILQRLEFHYTPKHGSWLNIAEIELNVLNGQCLDRRIADKETLINEVTAWNIDRNLNAATIHWQFTTPEARIKLKKLYPSFDA